MDRNEYLKMKRLERIAALQGKWVVVAESPKHPGQMMYYQDQEICSAGFWTSFLANAKGFAQQEEAQRFCAKLRFNNPKVTQIA